MRAFLEPIEIIDEPTLKGRSPTEEPLQDALSHVSSIHVPQKL